MTNQDIYGHHDDGAWYHGSPLVLTTLAAGSSVTRWRHLAEVFSHKPRVVSISDEGFIQHSGTQTGYLYVVDDDLSPDDIYPHPHTTMPEGREWLTRRPLCLKLLGPTTREDAEVLTDADVAELLKRHDVEGVKPQSEQNRQSAI